MHIHWKRFVIAGLISLGTMEATAVSRADSDDRPTSGGNFGIGVELGDPGSWGISGKLWADSVNAFQPAVKFDAAGTVILQLDYLWHNFDIIRLSDGGMPFYIGLGGNLVLQSTVQVAGRLPIGVSYIFDKKNFPVDLYFQVVPTLWFNSGGTTLDFYPEGGAHLYL